MAKRVDKPTLAPGTGHKLASSTIESTASRLPAATIIDWRTLDPATIHGELRNYRDKIEELLDQAAGQYVLIADQNIIAYFPDLESAASHAEDFFRDRSLLIKKVVATEPVHTLGGVIG
jgi:hypothetical protein